MNVGQNAVCVDKVMHLERNDIDCHQHQSVMNIIRHFHSKEFDLSNRGLDLTLIITSPWLTDMTQ